MSLNVGLSQIPNSVSIERNFTAICDELSLFEGSGVQLVVFPECALSGFSSAIRNCSEAVLTPYLEKIQAWSLAHSIDVVLPTALVREEKIFNSGFYFQDRTRTPFYKTGLTESEKGFFSLPIQMPSKVLFCQEYRLGLLLCFEAEHSPWSYFNPGEIDAILWPGYWGWDLESQWGVEKRAGEENQIYRNMNHWQVPLLQSNFARNDLPDHKGAGPEGLSVVVDENNQLIYRGAHHQVDRWVVKLNKEKEKCRVESVTPLKR